MKITETRCDRCGATIDKAQSTFQVIEIRDVHGRPLPRHEGKSHIQEGDLCGMCAHAFKRFMNDWTVTRENLQPLPATTIVC